MSHLTPLWFAIPLMLLASCGGEPPHPPATSSAAPASVHTATVLSQQWPTVYEATGTVRATTAAAISSKVVGYVQQVSAQVGDRVAAGQVLRAPSTPS